MAAAVVASAIATPASVGAEHSGAEAERAAREIQAARDQANAAAQAAFDAESQVDQLAVEIAATEQRVAELEVVVADLRADMSDAAVQRFVHAGGDDIPLLSSAATLADDGVAAVLQAAAIGNAAVESDEFDESLASLEEQRELLGRQREEADRQREQFEALQTRAEEQVAHLAEVERDRVADAEVQHALERQRRERLEREAAQAAANAAAARPVEPDTEQAAPSPAPAAPVVASDANAPAAPAPQAAPEPAPTAAPAPPPPVSTDGMICPVAGPTAYADTWGAPRSGGRTHEGVDMMSPHGTPLVAVESGSVQFKTNKLGGNAIWLAGSSGTRYYYAHLSAWEGSSRSVSQGEVIGYVGATGNTTANHLHFEVHPNGGVAVNPYPYVRAVC